MHPPGEPIVVFRADKARSNERDETFTGSLNAYDELSTWVTEKCVPLVREITFENAEELTEEGIPFLILFHKPEDNENVKKFNDVVRNELMSEKSKFHTCTNICLRAVINISVIHIFSCVIVVTLWLTVGRMTCAYRVRWHCQFSCFWFLWTEYILSVVSCSQSSLISCLRALPFDSLQTYECTLLFWLIL
jgi:hypothetical protein